MVWTHVRMMGEKGARWEAALTVCRYFDTETTVRRRSGGLAGRSRASGVEPGLKPAGYGSC